jgi:DNA-binding CsgD family transcriptional regulator
VYCAARSNNSNLYLFSLSIYTYSHVMEFENEKLIDREIEIGNCLMQGFSLKLIAEKTGLSKKILSAHINNMKIKLKAEDTPELIRLLRVMKP